MLTFCTDTLHPLYCPDASTPPLPLAGLAIDGRPQLLHGDGHALHAAARPWPQCHVASSAMAAAAAATQRMGWWGSDHHLTLADSAINVELRTRCRSAGAAAQLREALATEQRLGAGRVIAAAGAAPQRATRQAGWQGAADLLALAILVLPACCHSLAATVLASGSVEGAADASSICLAVAVVAATVRWSLGRDDPPESGGAQTRAQLSIGFAGYSIAAAAMAYLTSWALTVDVPLLTAALSVLILGWAVAAAWAVAPWLLHAWQRRQARYYEDRKLMRWRAAALAKVPLLAHMEPKDLSRSAPSHQPHTPHTAHTITPVSNFERGQVLWHRTTLRLALTHLDNHTQSHTSNWNANAFDCHDG